MKIFSSGMEKAELINYCKEYARAHIDDGIYAVKEKLIGDILDMAILSVYEDQRFFGAVLSEGASHAIRAEFWAAVKEEYISDSSLDPYRRGAGKPYEAYSGGHDYSHTAPNWENVLELGLFGLRERAKAALDEREVLSDRQKAFYRLVVSHYDGAFRMIGRMRELAERASVKDELFFKSLDNICKRPPQTLYEAMQTMIIYYTLQLIVDDNPVRTYGRLDKLLYPYYKSDIENGVMSKKEAAELTYDFLYRLSEYKIEANVPFAIAGDSFGEDLTNDYSYVLLREFIRLGSPDVKMHFLYSEKTPSELIKLALCGIIDGSNSIVFINDRIIKSALRDLDADINDAEDYQVVGCYESGAKEELTCSCNGKLNLAKAVEVAMNGGYDMRSGKLVGIKTPMKFSSFDDFYTAFKAQLEFFADGVMAIINAKEKSYRVINTSAYLSSTYDSAMQRGGDVYADFGAKYNNSSVNAIGIATAADSIYAIKKLVFDSSDMTFDKLRKIMINDWEGEELLRLRIKNKMSKYGQNNEEADFFAKDILATLGKKINGAPNAKGGKFRLGAFSIDYRFKQGENTAATPDGRRAGEPLSKNLGATHGADKMGLTPHILSVSKICGNDIPNGSVLDASIHKSAVRGESGNEVMLNTLKTFMMRGGFAIQYNVLNPDNLKDAQINSDKYPNLQVRLCGWNVLFSNLSRSEQDEFIASARENV